MTSQGAPEIRSGRRAPARWPGAGSCARGRRPAARSCPKRPCAPPGHRLRGGEDRLDDVVVAGAAADIAFELGAHGRLVEPVRMAADHVVGGHDHARRAEAALQAVMLLEGRLHRMQLGAVRPAPRWSLRSTQTPGRRAWCRTSPPGRRHARRRRRIATCRSRHGCRSGRDSRAGNAPAACGPRRSAHLAAVHHEFDVGHLSSSLSARCEAGPDRLRLPAPDVCRRHPEALGSMLPPPARVYCTFDRMAADIKIAKRRNAADDARFQPARAGRPL